MTGASDDSRGRVGARPWIVVGSLLALGAAGAMVFTADSRWLRLGIVAALWAALLGAFVATRNHRRARVSEQAAVDAQTVYELELEREVAARREQELAAVSEARSQLDSETRDEVESLRDEVTALRDSLQQLMGGELLYERVALTAQSTRMRQVGEQAVPSFADTQHGAVAAADAEGREVRSALDPGVPQRGMARQTEVFGTVPATEQRDSREAEVSQQQVARRAGSEGSVVSQPNGADAPARPPRESPQPPQRQPAQSPAQQSPPAQQPPRVPPTGQQRGGSAVRPRTDVTGGSRAHQPAPARPSSGYQPAAAEQQQSARQSQQPAGQPQQGHEQARQGYGQARQARGQPQQPAVQSQPPQQPQQHGSQAHSVNAQPSQPPSEQRQQVAPSMPNRLGTSSTPATPDPPRQDRYGGYSDDRYSDGGSSDRGSSDGGDERAETPADAADDSVSEQEQQSSAAESGGSHAEGRSVSELLAAYGTRSGSAPHRRRRAQ